MRAALLPVSAPLNRGLAAGDAGWNRVMDSNPIEGALEARYEIEAVAVDAPDRRLLVRWCDGHESRFHFVWLRHRCFYPAHRGADAADESLHQPDDPTAISIDRLKHAANRIAIRWKPDGAETEHEARWLRDNCYSKASRAERKHKPVLWGAAAAERQAWFDFADLDDEDAVFRLFLTVRDRGLARIRNVPVEPGTIARIAEFFGPLHESHYGRIFDVRTDSHIKVGATRSTFLGPHTDENYRHAPPGISLFHCLEAAPAGGGESILVDGYLAAARLAEADPEAFDLLTRVPIRFMGDTEDNGHLWAYGRAICRDLDGDVVGIRYTDRTLPPLDLPEDLVEPMYRALRGFTRELYAPDLALRYLMHPGDLNLFDNQRVLHGRTAFEAGPQPRHLQQCAVDRDEFHYRLRLMALRRGLKDGGLVMAGGALG